MTRSPRNRHRRSLARRDRRTAAMTVRRSRSRTATRQGERTMIRRGARGPSSRSNRDRPRTEAECDSPLIQPPTQEVPMSGPHPTLCPVPPRTPTFGFLPPSVTPTLDPRPLPGDWATRHNAFAGMFAIACCERSLTSLMSSRRGAVYTRSHAGLRRPTECHLKAINGRRARSLPRRRLAENTRARVRSSASSRRSGTGPRSAPRVAGPDG